MSGGCIGSCTGWRNRATPDAVAVSAAVPGVGAL